MTRSELLQLIQDNIPDNNSKTITAELVREVLDQLTNDGFIVDSDLLKDVNYDTGKTLEQELSEVSGTKPLWGRTGTFLVGGPSGQISGNAGIVTTAISAQLTPEDSQVSISFNQSIAGKRVVVNIFTTQTDTNANNDVASPVIRQQTNGIVVGLRKFSGAQPQVQLQVLVFESQ